SREKEKFIFLDRTADLAAELVLIENLLRAARTGRGIETARPVPEKVRCVERCVAKELEGRSVELVGARPRHHVHVRAWVPAVAGIIKRGLDLEFLKHVRVRNSKRHVEALNRASRPCSVNGDAVHRKSILAIEQAIHSHIGAALAESHGVANICYSARRHAQQARVVSGGQGQRSYCVRGYDGAYCRSGSLKRFDSRLDGDLFGLSTDFKTAVQHDRLGRSDPNSRCF